jgi:hypothetical protein
MYTSRSSRCLRHMIADSRNCVRRFVSLVLVIVVRDLHAKVDGSARCLNLIYRSSPYPGAGGQVGSNADID